MMNYDQMIHRYVMNHGYPFDHDDQIRDVAVRNMPPLKIMQDLHGNRALFI